MKRTTSDFASERRLGLVSHVSRNNLLVTHPFRSSQYASHDDSLLLAHLSDVEAQSFLLNRFEFLSSA